LVPSKPSLTRKEAPTLTMLESYGEVQTTPVGERRGRGTLVVLILFLGIAALGVGGWYWWSLSGTAQTGSNENPTTEVTSTETSNPATSTASVPVSRQTSATSSANEELRKLRERRINGTAADRDQIVIELAAAEKKFSDDYRFPYERAKLSIKGVVSHHEAFDALFQAAQRAIDNGQADEMLNSLMTDKDGDFYKLSRGHAEWNVLEQALRENNKSKLQH